MPVQLRTKKDKAAKKQTESEKNAPPCNRGLSRFPAINHIYGERGKRTQLVSNCTRKLSDRHTHYVVTRCFPSGILSIHIFCVGIPLKHCVLLDFLNSGQSKEHFLQSVITEASITKSRGMP